MNILSPKLGYYLSAFFINICLTVFICVLSIFLDDHNFQLFYGTIPFFILAFYGGNILFSLIFPDHFPYEILKFKFFAFLPFFLLNLIGFKQSSLSPLEQNYTLLATVEDVYDYDGMLTEQFSNKVMIRGEKQKISNYIQKYRAKRSGIEEDIDMNDRFIVVGGCTFKGYGIINGFTPKGFELNFFDMIFLSGFQFIIEIILNHWVSLTLSFVLLICFYTPDYNKKYPPPRHSAF